MEKWELRSPINFSPGWWLRQDFKGKVNERESYTLIFLGIGGVLPGTGVPPLFCPCMVLWHLGLKQVKPSWWGQAEILRLQWDGNELQGNLCPTFEAEQVSPVFLWMDSLVPVLWTQLEDMLFCKFTWFWGNSLGNTSMQDQLHNSQGPIQNDEFNFDTV